MALAAPPAEIAQTLAATPARVGLCVIDLDPAGGERFGVRADEVFTQASAIKVPILWTLQHQAVAGILSLDETLAIDASNGAGGCGVLQSFRSPATRVALGDLAAMMIVLSDNVATNLLIDRLGIDAVNAVIDERGGGEPTRLRRKMIDLEARAAGLENTSSPIAATELMVRLATDADSGCEASRETLRVLGLKKESPVTAALGAKGLATKPGMLDGLRTEWSLIEPAGERTRRYAMAIMANGADDTELEPLFRRIAEAVDCHMAGRSPA